MDQDPEHFSHNEKCSKGFAVGELPIEKTARERAAVHEHPTQLVKPSRYPRHENRVFGVCPLIW
jgi:hypothetical protein